FNDTATPEIYPLSLHDALPIFEQQVLRERAAALRGAEALALVVAPRQPGQLGHRAPEERVVRAHVHREPARIHFRGAEREHVPRSEEHTSELQSPYDLVCRLLL